jgi:hypothetical protein
MFRDETGLKGLQFWKTEVAAAGVSAAAAGKSFQQLGVAGGTAAGAAGQMTDVLIEAKNATSELGSKSVEDLKKYQAAILAAKDAGNLDKESKAALLAITKELAKRTKDFNDAQKKAAAEQARHLLELVDQYNALLKPVTKLTEESNRQSVGFAEAAQRAEENAERLRDMLKEFAGGDMNEIERLQRKVAEILEKQRREAEKINQEEEKRKAKLRETAEKIKDVAQGLLGVAQAAGVFSAETAAALHNLLAIGDAVKDIALSDKGIFNPANFTNLISAAGALAGVISSLFGESPETAARKELLEKNTQALRELTEVQGDILRINQPGARLQSAEDAIRAELSKSFPSFSGLGRELAKVGLSIADLEEIAQDLGISLRNPETGKLEGDAIRLLLEALEKLDVGFEETFRGAMDRLEALMAAGIIKPTQELAALADILTRGPNASSAISDALKDIDLFGDPDGAVAALQELIERFGRGELTKGELGGLSGDEFLDAILDLIRLLQDDQEDERLGSNRDPFDNPDVDETPRGGEIGDIDPFEPIRLGNEEAASFYEESLSIDQLQLDALNRLVEMGSPVLVAAPSLPSGGGGSGGISVVFEAGAVALSALPGEVTEDVARRAGEAIAGSTITAIAQQVDQIQGSTSRVRRVLIDGAVVRAA